MRTKKKSGKIVVALMAVMVMAAGAMVTANANNHENTTYAFTFTASNGRTYVTPVRNKMDATSSWMSCYSTTIPYTARVYAYNGSNYIDVSHGYIYEFYTGKTSYLKNWVYEGGYRASCIHAGSMNGPYDITWANGVWSPDSI